MPGCLKFCRKNSACSRTDAAGSFANRRAELRTAPGKSALISTIALATVLFVGCSSYEEEISAIEETINAFKPAIAALSDKLMVLVGKARKGSIDRAAQRFVKQGVPKELALTVARLRTLGAACDIVETARVLNLDGEPIQGLYAAGNVMASAMGMTYGGAGGTIGPGMVFGYLAGRHAAKLAQMRRNR